MNVSGQPVEYKAMAVVVRGQVCCREQSPPHAKGCSVLTTKTAKPYEMSDIKAQLGSELNLEQQQTLLTLLNEYRDCFAASTSELGKCRDAELTINLKDEKPVTFTPFKLSFSERAQVREIIKDLFENDIIRDSQSPYASRILLVKKKTGDLRMCVDYRALNAKTIKDCYPLPRTDEHLDRLAGCNYFTSLDLASGYHQIPVAQESIPKTAFIA